VFERGIGAGRRSRRFGTWALLTFVLLLFAPAIGGPTLLWWPPLLACGAATVGGVGYGLAGLFARGQRGPAVLGLLQAAVPITAVALLFVIASAPLNFD
jgi:hypothetical protein